MKNKLLVWRTFEMEIVTRPRYLVSSFLKTKDMALQWYNSSFIVRKYALWYNFQKGQQRVI